LPSNWSSVRIEWSSSTEYSSAIWNSDTTSGATKEAKSEALCQAQIDFQPFS
jgi:hypothetical protein